MPNNKTGKQVAAPYDVVIVGGGIAGLYCCHELIKKKEYSRSTAFSFLKLRIDLEAE